MALALWYQDEKAQEAERKRGKERGRRRKLVWSRKYDTKKKDTSQWHVGHCFISVVLIFDRWIDRSRLEVDCPNLLQPESRASSQILLVHFLLGHGNEFSDRPRSA